MQKTKERVAVVLRSHPILVFLIGMILVFSLFSPGFLSLSTLVLIVKRTSIVGVIAAGMTLVILIGEIDLSIGAIGAFSSVTCAQLMAHNLPWPLATLLTLLLCCCWGALNGWITTRFSLPAFLITMVMSGIIRTVSSLITGTMAIPIAQSGFLRIGTGSLLFIPNSVLILVFVYALGVFVMSRTPFGRCVAAIGGNTRAAALSGIRVDRIKLTVLILSSCMASISGLIMTSKLCAGTSQIGTFWEIPVIASVLIGGTQFGEGEGRLISTLLGSLCIEIISSFQTSLGMPSFTQELFRGVLILIAIILNSRKRFFRKSSAVPEIF